VPLAPDLGGSEHTTGAAHVTERSLTGTVCTSTRDTGNTGNGTSSTPGLSRCLVTSLLGAIVALDSAGVWRAKSLTRRMAGDGSCSCQCGPRGQCPGGWVPVWMSAIVQQFLMPCCIAMRLPDAPTLSRLHCVCMRRHGGDPTKSATTSNCEKRRGTDLEDIGDGDGVLGGLALGGDDGNGWPRHGVLCGRCCC
jgi:hypothetical protein